VQVREYQEGGFVQFRQVRTPADTFKAADDPMAICVLGQDPFVAAGRVGSGQDRAGRPFVVRKSDYSAGDQRQIVRIA
jgi:hypothetical protein